MEKNFYKLLLLFIIPISLSAQKKYISDYNDTISIELREDKKCLTLTFKKVLACCEYALIIKNKNNSELTLTSGPSSNENILSFCDFQNINIEDAVNIRIAKNLYDNNGNTYYVNPIEISELKNK
jgi:hypothetical protein